ncbi:MAG: hypothetical protein WCX97_04900 [Candidatus Magasanikbacteria bacterium]
MISKVALEEYKRIWKKQFNEEISDDKALESATKLLTLMEAIYKPITQKNLDKFETRRKKPQK